MNNDGRRHTMRTVSEVQHLLSYRIVRDLLAALLQLLYHANLCQPAAAAAGSALQLAPLCTATGSRAGEQSGSLVTYHGSAIEAHLAHLAHDSILGGGEAGSISLLVVVVVGAVGSVRPIVEVIRHRTPTLFPRKCEACRQVLRLLRLRYLRQHARLVALWVVARLDLCVAAERSRESERTSNRPAGWASCCRRAGGRTDASRLAGELKFGSDSIDSTETMMASMLRIGRQHSEAGVSSGISAVPPGLWRIEMHTRPSG